MWRLLGDKYRKKKIFTISLTVFKVITFEGIETKKLSSHKLCILSTFFFFKGNYYSFNETKF